MTPAQSGSLGEMLIERGIIGRDQMRIALIEQEKLKQPLGKILVSLGFITEATLRDTLSQSLGKKSIDLGNTLADPQALQLVPQRLCLRHRLLPIAWDPERKCLTLAMADVDDLIALDRVRALLPATVVLETVISGETEIASAIDRCYGHTLSIDGILHEIENGGGAGKANDNTARESTPQDYLPVTSRDSRPIIRLIDALLVDAVKREASDLHFEPEAGFLRIRYRIDGMLRQIRVLHPAYWPAMAVRLKVMSGMNIAETRAPQDGACQLSLNGRIIDFRVAAQPTIHGENIVLRILDRQKGILPLDQRGLSLSHWNSIQRMLARPEGMILVTGPTGSGKTSTLYSLLSHINTESINIMTLEDPVEYPIPMLRQTSVSEAAKFGFANSIRSLMRQDPDVILVGEIRDAETASMAFRAAMTGHQVYSTLHSNSAIGAIPRLLDIGTPPGILAGNIIGIIAQRLLRRLCLACRQSAPANITEQALLGLASGTELPELCHPVGCAECEFQGFRGRLAIMELLLIDRSLDVLIAGGSSTHEIHEQAEENGFQSLADDGIRHVLAGTTSLAELMRVVDLGSRMPVQ